MDAKKIWVVIPAFNEAPRINEVIIKTRRYLQNIIVVDDGSTDKTLDEALRSNITVLQHSRNVGKGVAVRTGCDYAMQKGAESIIMLDGDGQHDPEKIPDLIYALEFNDIVFGCRSLSGQMPKIRRVGNWMISTALRWLFNIKISDALSGYKAFTKRAYPRIRWKSRGFTVESEIAINTSINKLKHAEVEIPTNYNKKTSIPKKQGIIILMYIIKKRLEV